MTDETREEHLRREMLTAPLRTLAAAVVGGCLAFIAFGLVWLTYLPSQSRDTDVFIEMLLRVALTAAVGLGFGMAVAALRLVRGWLSVAALLLLGSIGGLVNGGILTGVLSVGCDAGQRLPVFPEWCERSGAGPVLGVLLKNALAGLFVSAALLPFGLKPRAPAIT